jgi:DNA polymerase III alpha subunit
LEQADALSGTVTWKNGPETQEKRLVEAGFDLADPRVKQVVFLADQLRGFPRHLSIHVGGFVLSSRPTLNITSKRNRTPTNNQTKPNQHRHHKQRNRPRRETEWFGHRHLVENTGATE